MVCTVGVRGGMLKGVREQSEPADFHPPGTPAMPLSSLIPSRVWIQPSKLLCDIPHMLPSCSFLPSTAPSRMADLWSHTSHTGVRGEHSFNTWCVSDWDSKSCEDWGPEGEVSCPGMEHWAGKDVGTISLEHGTVGRSRLSRQITSVQESVLQTAFLCVSSTFWFSKFRIHNFGKSYRSLCLLCVSSACRAVGMGFRSEWSKVLCRILLHTCSQRTWSCVGIGLSPSTAWGVRPSCFPCITISEHSSSKSVLLKDLQSGWYVDHVAY